ncbi:PREDICTED: uncharacterized protein LOC100631676 [Amphimedon queenslandica]|uniref:Uncharacterized protein n=1 Tax=Amphimedon queenslandica TaxID=400682 RepID=A0AAN0JQS3_AMPQE|nr:PREDICTED: uncharacterized protein LOC100631676 [Amphimedon queenslandica]|eukprot:XP_019859178.1 PREDICTED: uncharacterized protein LOC100631676 [Amphimedon queenslandica]
MGEDDPIQFHYFYGKMYSTYPFHLHKDEVSRFLPAHGEFQETAVLWYYCDDDATVTAALWEYFNLSKLKPTFKDALETVYAKRQNSEPVDEDLKAKIKRFRSEQ